MDRRLSLRWKWKMAFSLWVDPTLFLPFTPSCAGISDPAHPPSPLLTLDEWKVLVGPSDCLFIWNSERHHGRRPVSEHLRTPPSRRGVGDKREEQVSGSTPIKTLICRSCIASGSSSMTQPPCLPVTSQAQGQLVGQWTGPKDPSTWMRNSGRGAPFFVWKGSQALRDPTQKLEPASQLSTNPSSWVTWPWTRGGKGKALVTDSAGLLALLRGNSCFWKWRHLPRTRSWVECRA